MSPIASNVVEVVVRAKNETGAAFGEAKAGAEEVAAGADAAAEATVRLEDAQLRYARAQGTVLDAELKLEEVRQSESATDADLSAAQDRLTAATLRQTDAQIALLKAEHDQETAALGSGAAAEETAAKSEKAGLGLAAMSGKVKMAALGVGVGLGLAVKGAMDFQQQTVKLTTSAGESAKNLGMVQQGILSLSSSTNTSTEELAKGMYTVESAGFHGAQGLQVLKAAAQGAQAEGADMGEVANAVTSALNAYGLKAKDATSVTQQMVAAVGSGKMTMQDLASSLSNVLPLAASAHLSFAQVGGAIATMTSMGMSAQQSTQDLNNMIRNLQGGSATAANEMKALGLNANEVTRNLGRVGLTGTMQMLTEAILRNTSGGNVMLGFMNEMTPQAKGLAREILAGSISTGELSKAVRTLNPEQAALIARFRTSATSATGLKQTFDTAMKAMTGGTTGLNVALMLTGHHAKTFEKNVATVAGAAHTTGSSIKGWSTIQHEANFQLGSAAKAVKAMGDQLGLALLPAVTAVVTPLASMMGWIASNRAAADAFAIVVGGVLAGALGAKLAGAFKDVKAGIEGFGSGIQWAAGKLGILTGAQEAQTAATEAAAVAQEEMDAAEMANPIGLIIAAIIALIVVIVEVVKHWKFFERIGSEAMHAVTAAARAAFGWIRDHWKLLLVILTGPIGLAAVFIADHWRQIMHGAAEAVDWVRSHWPLLLAILTGPIGLAALFIADHWRQITAGAQRTVGDVESFFKSLPGRIVSAVGDLGNLLFGAGERVVQGLINGIMSQLGAAGHAIGSVVSEIKSYLPFSPAKKGPLSGAGAPVNSGLSIGRQLAEGLTASTSHISRAAHGVAAAAAGGHRALGGALAPHGGYAAYAAGAGHQPQRIQVVLEVNPTGDAFTHALVQAIRYKVRDLGGGGPYSVQRAFGRVTPE